MTTTETYDTWIEEFECVLSGQASPDMQARVAARLRSWAGETPGAGPDGHPHEVSPPLRGDDDPSNEGWENAGESVGRRVRLVTRGERRGTWSWRSLGRFGVVAVVGFVCAAVMWGLIESRSASASARRHLVRSREQVQRAFELCEYADYARSEQILIAAREDLDTMAATTFDVDHQRRLLLSRVWALQGIVQANHGAYEAAHVSCQNALSLLPAQPHDRRVGDGELALAAAFAGFAEGEVKFQDAMRRRGEDESRWTLLGGAIDSYRRAREMLLESGGIERRVEAIVLEARIVSATGVTLHKSVRDAADSERIRGEALRLSGEAEDLLHRVDRSAVGSMWDAFYAQIIARRGLSLASLGRYRTAIEQYEAGIAVLQANGNFRELGTYYYLGLLYGNQADALASSGDRVKEIEARTSAIDHLKRFWAQQGTSMASVNVSLNYGRRAIARFALGERQAAIADTAAFAALGDFEQLNVVHPQLSRSEMARLFLLLAMGSSDSIRDREAALERCESQVRVTLEQGEISRVELRTELAAFVSDPELAESPITARLRALLEQ